jgi:hypothetical protein
MDKVSPDSRQEALDILYEISKLLNCQIDKETLSILVRLVSQYVIFSKRLRIHIW